MFGFISSLNGVYFSRTCVGLVMLRNDFFTQGQGRRLWWGPLRADDPSFEKSSISSSSAQDSWDPKPRRQRLALHVSRRRCLCCYFFSFDWKHQMLIIKDKEKNYKGKLWFVEELLDHHHHHVIQGRDPTMSYKRWIITRESVIYKYRKKWKNTKRYHVTSGWCSMLWSTHLWCTI